MWCKMWGGKAQKAWEHKWGGRDECCWELLPSNCCVQYTVSDMKNWLLLHPIPLCGAPVYVKQTEERGREHAGASAQLKINTLLHCVLSNKKIVWHSEEFHLSLVSLNLRLMRWRASCSNAIIMHVCLSDWLWSLVWTWPFLYGLQL